MPTGDNDPAREQPEQECLEVPFPGDSTCPKTIPPNPQSGGFIQLTWTADQTTKKTWQTANIWGSATTIVSGSRETNLFFLGQTREIIEGDRFGGVQPLQYMKWMHGKMTRIIRFNFFSTSDTAYIIKATVYELKNERPELSKKEIGPETAGKPLIKLELVGQVDLMRQEGPLPTDLANNMRIVPLKSTSSTADPGIVIALFVSSNHENSVQNTIASLTIRDGTLSATIDEQTYGDLPLPQSVKPFTGQDQEPGIMLFDFKPDPSINKTSMVVEHIVPSTQSEWQRHTFEDTFDTTATSDAWSILVCPSLLFLQKKNPFACQI